MLFLCWSQSDKVVRSTYQIRSVDHMSCCYGNIHQLCTLYSTVFVSVYTRLFAPEHEVTKCVVVFAGTVVGVPGPRLRTNHSSSLWVPVGWPYSPLIPLYVWALLPSVSPGDGFWWSLSGAGHVNWGGTGPLDGGSLSGCHWGGEFVNLRLQPQTVRVLWLSIHSIPWYIVNLIPFHTSQFPFHSILVNLHSIPY